MNSNEQRFLCSECNDECDGRNDLVKHVSTCHLGWSRYECLQCKNNEEYPYFAATVDQLRVHFDRRHPNKTFVKVSTPDSGKKQQLNRILYKSGAFFVKPKPVITEGSKAGSSANKALAVEQSPKLPSTLGPVQIVSAYKRRVSPSSGEELAKRSRSSSPESEVLILGDSPIKESTSDGESRSNSAPSQTPLLLSFPNKAVERVLLPDTAHEPVTLHDEQEAVTERADEQLGGNECDQLQIRIDDGETAAQLAESTDIDSDQSGGDATRRDESVPKGSPSMHSARTDLAPVHILSYVDGAIEQGDETPMDKKECTSSTPPTERMDDRFVESTEQQHDTDSSPSAPVTPQESWTNLLQHNNGQSPPNLDDSSMSVGRGLVCERCKKEYKRKISYDKHMEATSCSSKRTRRRRSLNNTDGGLDESFAPLAVAKKRRSRPSLSSSGNKSEVSKTVSFHESKKVMCDVCELEFSIESQFLGHFYLTHVDHEKREIVRR